MQILAFQINLIDPLLVIMLGSGDANQLESFGYVPGSVIRNALASRYIKDNKLGQQALQDKTCHDLFFADKVRFLNAYPVDRNNQRTLPTPLSWRAEKEKLTDFHDDIVGTLDITDFSHNPEAELSAAKAIGRPFCQLHPQESGQSPEVEFVQARQRVMLHNARSKRRVIADEISTLFQYESLAEGEWFIGLILADDQVDLAPLQAILFEASLSLGKSRGAGYGRIEVTPINAESPWQQEYGLVGDDDEPEDDETIIITLLSDALVRDLAGTYTTDFTSLLAKDPNRKLAPLDGSAFQTQIIGGFNRKWGLQLPQAMVVKMGSVFVFATKDIDHNKLAYYKQYGLGERCADGFGRIAVNWHRYSKITGKKFKGTNLDVDAVTLKQKSPSYILAQRVVEYQLRQQLDLELLKQIALLTIEPSPSKSQLSRVRQAARQALENKTLTPLASFLENIEGKKAHRELQQSRINDQPLYDWLKTHSQPDALGWQVGQPELGGVSAKFSQSLKIEYTARLIEGVVKRALDQQKGGTL